MMNRHRPGSGVVDRRWLALAVAAVAWAALAFLILPGLIERAYHGTGPAALVRLLDRPGRKPLPHYQALGRDLATAGLLGLAAQASLTAFLPRLGLDRRTNARLLLLSAVALAFAVLTGPRQDYAAYLEIWGHVGRGGDPWWIDPARGYPLNAYGPLFLALTPVSMLHPLAPKVLVTTVALGGLAWFASRLAGQGAGRARGAIALAIASIHVLIHTAWFGHFDVLAAVATVAAVSLARGGREAAAGASLGVGFLIKLMPAAVLPFLLVDCDDVLKRRVRWRFALVAVATMAAGLLGAWLVWGDSCLRPFRFATVRASQGLSALRSLRAVGIDLDGLSLPILLGACGVVWVACVARRLDVTTSAACGMLTTLLAYKVGFAQYQTVLIALLLDQAIASGRWRLALLAYLGWIAGFDLFDWSVGGVVGGPSSRWAWVEAAAGAPTTALGLWLLVSLLIPMPGDTVRCVVRRER
jgi:hypothetical protein